MLVLVVQAVREVQAVRVVPEGLGEVLALRVLEVVQGLRAIPGLQEITVAVQVVLLAVLVQVVVVGVQREDTLLKAQIQ